MRCQLQSRITATLAPSPTLLVLPCRAFPSPCHPPPRRHKTASVTKPPTIEPTPRRNSLPHALMQRSFWCRTLTRATAALTKHGRHRQSRLPTRVVKSNTHRPAIMWTMPATLFTSIINTPESQRRWPTRWSPTAPTPPVQLASGPREFLLPLSQATDLHHQDSERIVCEVA